MSNAEQPDYKLIISKDTIEIRDYPPLILAEVEVSGERKQAINEGFRILADYIFGNNISNKVTESHELSEKIAMTAPVIQQKHKDKWKIRFIMPKKYSMETLPKPNSKNIQFIQLPSKRFAVICFSNVANAESIEQHTGLLIEFISAEKLQPLGEAILAFYNPPWTLPHLRRNEVMIEIGVQDG